MELGLRLGDAAKPSGSTSKIIKLLKGRSLNPSSSDVDVEETEGEEEDDDHHHHGRLAISLKPATAQGDEDDDPKQSGSMDPPIQLDLLPQTPVPRNG